MSEQRGGLSRRNFVNMVGAAGGIAAVHETLVALGLMRHPSAWAGPPECNPKSGEGQDVVILGAGLGGLATAYWLQQAGYSCTILEAQDRIGGRSYTARRGDKVYEEGADQPQECKFDDGLYINLGPGRIPYHHRRVMHLCKKLRVPLEVYVHSSDHNLHFMSTVKEPPLDRAIERRRLANDTQGYVSELLAKAVNQNALDHELLEEDKEKLLSLLRKFGDLDRRFRYRGSTRAGCPQLPVDVKTSCASNVLDAFKPLGLDVLLQSEFWDPCLVGAPQLDRCDPTDYQHGFYQVQEDLWQTTSFQPVGGMGQIVETLAGKVGEGSILKNAVVHQVDLIEGGEKVRVAYRHRGKQNELIADLCVSNIPLTVLKDLRTPHFSADFRGAVQRSRFSNACKVGWQANRRFWEEDHQIYGGISWTDHPITQMWYPSNDYFAPNGVLTGAYNYGATAEAFGKLSPEARLSKAYEGGLQLHPAAFGEVPKELGISIAWQKVKFQRGCYAVWSSDDPQHELDYERLLVPDMEGRFFVVGDQVSTLPGWQEGALISAEHVVDQITTGQDMDLDQIREQIDRAPMSLAVMG